MSNNKKEGFDLNWKERLKNYPKTAEFKKNLKLLKQEINKRAPNKKPKKKYLFTLMGIPGSGKSTISEIVKSLHPAIIIGSDWIFFKKLRSSISGDYYKAYVYQEFLTRNYLQKGYSVVLDANNRYQKTRSMVYQLARKYKAKPILIKINIDLDTAVDRVTLKGGEKQARKEKLKGLKSFASQTEELTNQEKKDIHIINIDGRESIKKIKARLKREFKKL